MNVSNVLAIGTAITTLAALTTLTILFFQTANSALYTIENNDSGDGSGDNDDGDDDDGKWWEDLDLKREERATLKIALNTLLLGIASATLFVPMTRVWHPSKGLYDRFNLGVLAASTFMVGNIMFVSFWNSANFAAGEEQENDNNNNNNDDNNGDDDGNNDDNYEMDEEELLAHHRKIASISSLILALAFSAISACIYHAGKKLPETGRHPDSSSSSNSNSETTKTSYAQGKSAAHMELFYEIWKVLSTCTIAIFSILFLAACILSLGEEGERRREEGGAINLIFVLLWMIIVTTGILVMGRKILGETKLNGELGLGILSGGTMYFALLLFVVFVLNVNVEDRPGREDGAGLATSFACFFLSIMYLAFSLGMYKFQDSFIGGIIAEDDSSRVDDSSSTGDFWRMKDEIGREAVVEFALKVDRLIQGLD
mmetsp:Transcript_9344/g.21071  ORF Transcript_9344/g.21071 Transcript_9344/m.21071 type:complete len:428 (+) Transcript_9344:187-1470(+)